MPVSFGQRFSASVSGSVEKAVRCERCGRYFTYTLSRRVVAEAVAPLNVGREAAVVRAQARAHQALREKLQDAVDPHPCPGCGHVQSEMVVEAKKRWFLGSTAAGLLIAIVAGLGPGVYRSLIYHVAFWPWLPGLIGGLGLMFVGAMLAAVGDPNQSWIYGLRFV